MTPIIRPSLRLYIKHFPLYLTILSPVLIPTIFLHIVGRFANFGELMPVFTAILGVILNIITLFVILSLIMASAMQERENSLAPGGVFRAAFSRFLPFLALFIVVSLATFSVPAFLAIIGRGIEFTTALTVLSIISIAWIIAITLITMFSGYVLVIERQGPIASIRRSVTLFLHRPLKTSLRFVGILLATITMSLIMAIATTLIVAAATRETAILFNLALAESLVPWWKDLIVSIYAYLGLPFLVIAATHLFSETRSAESEKYEPQTGNRVGSPRPA